MLDIVDRVPRVLWDDVNDMRDAFLVGEGVRWRPEELVLVLESVSCVDSRRTNFESFCSRNSKLDCEHKWRLPKTMFGASTMQWSTGRKSFAEASSTSMDETAIIAFSDTSDEAPSRRLLSVTFQGEGTLLIVQSKV